MGKTAYIEKLKDPRWQKKRLEVFQRDNFTCQKCFDDQNNLPLAVHHLHYEKGKEPWEYPIERLTTLCEDCHQEEYENQYASEAELIKSLRLAGFFHEELEALSLVFYDEHAKGCIPLFHVTEVVISMIAWMLRSDTIQREMLDRYFKDFLGSSKTSNNMRQE
jgi:hypothetical protein